MRTGAEGRLATPFATLTMVWKSVSITTAAVPNILTWSTDSTRILYWNKFGTPDSVLGRYGDELSIPVYWWYDPDSARELKEAMETGAPLPGRTREVYYDEVMPPTPAPAAASL